jgi:hypothetical protein
MWTDLAASIPLSGKCKSLEAGESLILRKKDVSTQLFFKLVSKINYCTYDYRIEPFYLQTRGSTKNLKRQKLHE